MPVSPTAFGTVMIQEERRTPGLLRPLPRSGRCATFSMMWMPLSVSRILCTGKATLVSSLGITSTAQVSAPTRMTFCDASHCAAATAEARFAAVVGRVLRRELLEQVAPAGVDEHRIAFTQRHVVQLQPGLQIGFGDHRARVEARALAGGIGLQLACLPGTP